MLARPYKIKPSPDLTTITPGAKMIFRADGAVVETAPRVDPRFFWGIYRDLNGEDKQRVAFTPNADFSGQFTHSSWSQAGKYTVVCIVKHGNATLQTVTHDIWVESEEAILGREMANARQKGLARPVEELLLTGRYIRTLKKAAEFAPPPNDKAKTKHDQLIRDLETYETAVRNRIEMRSYKTGYYPLRAVHLDKEKQAKTQLRICLAAKDLGVALANESDNKPKRWCVIDWTNPSYPHLSGTYEGVGFTHEDAIKNAIKKWQSGNSYPPGRVTFETDPNAKIWGSMTFDGSFETDGKSFAGTVSEFLESVAFVAAILAGILTAIAPEPGSKVVSGLIWTAIFSSSAAAVINIGERRDQGFADWKQDSIDALTIVSNIFAGAGIVAQGWRRGAQVSLKAAKFEKWVLLGQVATDAIDGVLLADNAIVEIEAIINDKTLSPEDRTNALLKLLSKVALSGAMIAINIKATKQDLDNLKAGKLDKKKLEELGNPKAHVDLNPPPKVDGHTSKGKSETTIQDRQTHAGEAKKKRPQIVFDQKTIDRPPAGYTKRKEAWERGMRGRDHMALLKASQEGDKFIIMRNSNPAAVNYIGKPGYKPKPMELKAKTRKTPPNVGLAAADTSLKGEAFAAHVKELEKKGFKVGTAEEGFIVKDKAGNAFYSDYDLHGVYSKGGADAYSESVRSDLNKRFGVDMVQHGPHDNWPDRLDKEKAGPNRGPQPPCTAYLPDGRTCHLETIADMKRFYKEFGLPWDAVWKGQF